MANGGWWCVFLSVLLLLFRGEGREVNVYWGLIYPSVGFKNK